MNIIKITALVMVATLANISHAQNAITIMGGDAAGSEGSMSFSAGEVAVRHSEARAITVVNITEYFTEGVQQAFAGDVVGIENPLPFDVSVFPNPAQDWVEIVIDNGSDASKMVCALYNLEGKLLWQSPLEGGAALIDLTSYSEGTYFLRLSPAENTQNSQTANVYKIIKTR